MVWSLRRLPISMPRLAPLSCMPGMAVLRAGVWRWEEDRLALPSLLQGTWTMLIIGQGVDIPRYEITKDDRGHAHLVATCAHLPADVDHDHTHPEEKWNAQEAEG